MKFALVNGESQEAQPGLKGICSGCESVVIAKCGPQKINHWSHHKLRDCDTWWENETQWHRNWKNHFLKESQEVVHRSSSGELHRADVKTDKGWVLEFQYSAISSDERESRNEFYEKIVWIVNGIRRKRDAEHFSRSLKFVGNLGHSLVNRVFEAASEKSALLRDWQNHSVPVVFDFLQPEVVWCLLPKKPEGQLILLEISRTAFIKIHANSGASQRDEFKDFLDLFDDSRSASDIIDRINKLRRQEEQMRLMKVDEARRKNPFINHRAQKRF